MTNNRQLPPDKLRRSGKMSQYLAAAVALVTLLLYLPSLRGELLIWDDTLYVINNPHIRTLDLNSLAWAFTNLSAGFWQPVVWISFAVDYALWGLNPVGFHLTAVIVHAVVTFMVVLLAMRLFAAAQKEEAGGVTALSGGACLLAAGLTGLLFGLHPLHVESVAWVSERKDLLCALFFIGSLIAYLDHAAAESPGRYGSRYFIALFLFVLALASKTMAVTLPLVLLILDYYPLARFGKGRRPAAVIAEKVPFFLLSLLCAVVSMVAQKNVGALATSLPLSERTLTAFRGVGLYLWKMLVPLKLIPYYPYPARITLFSAEYLPAVLAVLVITVLCLLQIRERKFLLAAWTYFLVTLLPVLGFVPLGAYSLADRYTYLPSIAPFLLAGVAAAGLWQLSGHGGRYWNPLRIAFSVAGIGCLGLLSALLLRQIAVWNNSVSLWSHVIEKGPYEISLAYNNRGMAYLEQGDYARAISDCTRALELQSGNALAYYNRGKSYLHLGQLDLAMADVQNSIAHDPKYADAYALRGEIERAGGGLTAAINDYTKALALDPELFEVYLYRGIAYKESGDFVRAIEDYNRTLALVPDNAEAYNSRGAANRRLGRLDLAIADYSRAIALHPGFSLAYCNRGIVYKELKDYDRAIADFRQATSFDPDLVKAYLELADCFLAAGRPDLARAEYAEACSRKSAEACRALQELK